MTGPRGADAVRSGPAVPWTAIVLAGQRPGTDPLAAHFGTRFKALVPLAGRPMIAFVLSALLQAPEIGRIVVLAQEDLLHGPLGWARLEARISQRRSRGSISESVAEAIGALDAPWPVLVTTADHPLLTPAILRGFTAAAAGCDLAIGAVERRVMLASFPDSRRTWLRFRGGAYTGANLFAFLSPRATAALAFWAEAERDRKRPWKLFRRFGPRLALAALTRTVSLPAAVKRAGGRLGLAARLVELEQAVAGIDVDKPGDHRLVERLLAGR